MAEHLSNNFLQQLRGNWKFPAVVYFCRVFEAVLNMSPFSSDLFEVALISSKDHIIFMTDIVTKLMTPGRRQSHATPTVEENGTSTESVVVVVGAASWESSLQKKVGKNWHLTLDRDLLSDGRRFFELTPIEKLDVLHLLVEVALEHSALIRETIKNTVEDANLTADALRNTPIGEDADGSEYFLFSLRYEDCRVYKQSYHYNHTDFKHFSYSSDFEEDSPYHEIRNEDITWHTVCTTLKEIEDLADSFKDTKNKEEKKLYAYLLEVLPEFVKTEKKRKKAEERALKQEKVKRSDRIKAMVKRREAEKINKVKEEEMEDLAIAAAAAVTAKGKNDKTDASGLSMGLSRAERAFYRNQRKELAKQGLRSVIAGKKRPLEYDGYTPLGSAITKMCQKRIQKVRPHRNMNKLTAIVWEKFKRPVQHRAQFQAFLDNYSKINERERVFVQTKKKEEYQQQPMPLASRIIMSHLPYPKTLNVMNSNVLSKRLDKEDNDRLFEQKSFFQIPITRSLLHDQDPKVTHQYNNDILRQLEMSQNNKVFEIVKNNIIPVSHDQNLTLHQITSSNHIQHPHNHVKLSQIPIIARAMPVHTPDPNSLRYIETLPRNIHNNKVITPPMATIVPVCQIQPRTNDTNQPKHTILLQAPSPGTYYPLTRQRVSISPNSTNHLINNGNNSILMSHQTFPPKIVIPVSYGIGAENKGN